MEREIFTEKMIRMTALLIGLLFAIFTVLPTEAAVRTLQSELTNYQFTYKLGSQQFNFETKSHSWEDAFEKGAQACFKNFKKGRKLSEEVGLDIIDTCANPRS